MDLKKLSVRWYLNHYTITTRPRTTYGKLTHLRFSCLVTPGFPPRVEYIEP